MSLKDKHKYLKKIYLKWSKKLSKISKIPSLIPYQGKPISEFKLFNIYFKNYFDKIYKIFFSTFKKYYKRFISLKKNKSLFTKEIIGNAFSFYSKIKQLVDSYNINSIYREIQKFRSHDNLIKFAGLFIKEYKNIEDIKSINYYIQVFNKYHSFMYKYTNEFILRGIRKELYNIIIDLLILYMCQSVHSLRLLKILGFKYKDRKSFVNQYQNWKFDTIENNRLHLNLILKSIFVDNLEYYLYIFKPFFSIPLKLQRFKGKNTYKSLLFNLLLNSKFNEFKSVRDFLITDFQYLNEEKKKTQIDIIYDLYNLGKENKKKNENGNENINEIGNESESENENEEERIIKKESVSFSWNLFSDSVNINEKFKIFLNNHFNYIRLYKIQQAQKIKKIINKLKLKNIIKNLNKQEILDYFKSLDELQYNYVLDPYSRYEEVFVGIRSDIYMVDNHSQTNKELKIISEKILSTRLNKYIDKKHHKNKKKKILLFLKLYYFYNVINKYTNNASFEIDGINKKLSGLIKLISKKKVISNNYKLISFFINLNKNLDSYNYIKKIWPKNKLLKTKNELSLYNILCTKININKLKYRQEIKPAIFYIKPTASNVFLYIIYNNKLMYKKTIGEINDFKKKDRRYWRNVYPATNVVMNHFDRVRKKYNMKELHFYINGDDSFFMPVLKSVRKFYKKRKHRSLKGLMTVLTLIIENAIEIRLKFKHKYILFDNIKKDLEKKIRSFNRKSKRFLKITKIKDITSWPFNGCKAAKRKRKNAR